MLWLQISLQLPSPTDLSRQYHYLCLTFLQDIEEETWQTTEVTVEEQMVTITNEQSDYLLSLSKKVCNGDKLLDRLVIDQCRGKQRFELVSKDNGEYSFLWEVFQSSKNTLHLSLHFQEEDSKIGLLRIDYNGTHTNPTRLNEYVPERFHRYVGIELRESHVHHHVQGYRSLAWAIPLIDDN
ncbi:MAG: hypothetical protein LBB27_03465, partial [Tannerellaceae bacterium]|nr:hypothetical protein [Tannerellaceae bacterium]